MFPKKMVNHPEQKNAIFRKSKQLISVIMSHLRLYVNAYTTEFIGTHAKSL